jgi:methylase of polypeptide subunit release factors
LSQLIRFDDPVEAAIEQTRTFQNQNRKEDRVNIEVLQNSYSIHPAVFNPTYFPSTEWYAKMINKYITDNQSFCEVGCGAGIISCYLAKQNPNLKILATDINPFATENTLYNAQKNNIENRISIATGDVLDCVGNVKFDSIFWAMPF